MRRNFKSLIVFAAFALAWLGWKAYDARPLVPAPETEEPSQAIAVVELFTSEGCSSCPPADRLLAEVAEAEGIYALSFHVDYWDHLDWRDPHSQRAFTISQRHYAAKLTPGKLYTPQVVVNGTRETIGSSRYGVRAALATALAKPASATVSLEAGAGELRYSVKGAAEGTLVHAATILPRSITRPENGENAAREWSHTNVVLELRTDDLTADGKGSFSLPASPVIVYVQDPQTLAVLGASRWDPSDELATAR